MKIFLIFMVAIMLLVPVLSGCTSGNGTSTPNKTAPLNDGGSVGAVTQDGKLYNVLDNGIVVNSLEKAKENTKAINRLISSCPKGAEIYFPEGKYYLESDNSCIRINNKTDLRIYGDNAVIINTSFDPTAEITNLNYSDSMTVGIHKSKNIRIEGLAFDYYRYTQACGKIISKAEPFTIIELDPRFLDGTDKPKITGNEIASAIAVLDEHGAAVEDHYAEAKFGCILENNRLIIYKAFGKIGQDVVVRFNLSTAPAFYAQETQYLTVNNVRSYSSPAAAFLMSGEGNESLTFNNVTVAPPENAVWRWGANADGIFINCMRGELNVTNCTFMGMGDDALNVHSSAARVRSVNGSKITLNYGYNDAPISNSWLKENDTLIFYKSDFSICARARVEKFSFGTVTLKITEGSVSVGDIAENASLSPKVNIESVTVNGGRARAFLIQTDNVRIKDCNISNLGLAGIIISPDIEKWYEMGPAENVEISGCTFAHLCAMGNSSCKGAIFSSSSHDGNKANAIIHKNIVITRNSFNDITVPIVDLTSANGVTLKDNRYTAPALAPVISNCENVTVE